MSKTVRLSSSPYRMLVTDILPYERPTFFSNRFFARLMKYYGVRNTATGLVATKHTETKGLKEFLRLLSGSAKGEKRPFKYVISKDGVTDGRTLTVIHPRYQIEMMEFYEKYQDLLIYYCSRSPFSLRHPYKVARTIKGTAEFAKVISDDNDDSISPEAARTYFCYSPFSKISMFYESYLFLRLEKQFQCMAKVDVKECFDSITPEALPALIFGNSDDNMRSFVSELADLHRKMRGEEAERGIVIGPEFSRIFAEMFLQQIERKVEARLAKDNNMVHPRDYRVLRYVDDTFVYANSLTYIKNFLKVYEDELEKYGLEFKTEKMKVYRSKPFIEPMTLVKRNLRDIIDKTFENRLQNFIGFIHVQDGKYDVPTFLKFRKFIGALRGYVSSVVTPVSENIEEHREEWENKDERGKNLEELERAKHESRYKDISNYLIWHMRARLQELLKQFNDLYRHYSQEEKYAVLSDTGEKIKNKYERVFVDFCMELVEVLMFIFNSDLRMSTAINVIQVINEIQAFVRGKYRFSNGQKSVKFPAAQISRIDEKITDETHQVFRHKRIIGESGLMEVLMLLELQPLMFPRNRVSEDVLLKFLESIESDKVFNFLTIFQLFHFADHCKRYDKISKFASEKVRRLLEAFRQSNGDDTEGLLAVLELIASRKDDVDLPVELDEIFNNLELRQFIDSKREFFIMRESYTLSDAMLTLKSEEVY